MTGVFDFGEVKASVDTLRANVLALLKHTGLATTCAGPNCGKPIYKVRHLDSGRVTPYDLDGTNHFITCADAPLFKRKKETHAGKS